MLELTPKTTFGIKPAIADSSSHSIQNANVELTLTPQEKPKNNFIGETFDEFKHRIFNENLQKLTFLMDKIPEKLSGCEIKKREGRYIQLIKSGIKVMELFNHEVLYFQNNELVDLLKQYIPEKLNSPFILSQK